MRVLLAYPPSSDPTYPFPALPALAAHLKANGRQDVFVWDANLALHLKVLTPRFIREAAAIIHCRKDQLETQSTLNPVEQEEYQRIALTLPTADWVLRSVADSVDVMRSPRFFSYPDYASARRCMQRAYALASTATFPARIGPDGYFPGGRLADDRGIQAAVAACANNIIGRLLTQLTRQALEAHPPDVVGFSVTYREQLVPALLMARVARQLAPGVRRIFGGTYASRLTEVIADFPELWREVDFFVRGDGEDPLLVQLQELEKDAPDFTCVPNLVWMDAEQGLQHSPKSFQMIPNELALPDYSDLDLAAYLSPEPVIGLPATRGCNWGRCEFCSFGVTQAAGNPFREAKPQTVVRWMEALHQRHGVRHFCLATDTTRAQWLLSFAEIVRASGRPFFWQTLTRGTPQVDASLLHRLGEAGCRQLVIGFESAVDAVVDAMKKGASPDILDRIISQAEPTEVALTFLGMVGFPGETEEQARQNLAYLTDQASRLSFISLGPFQMLRGAPIFARTDEVGIRLMQPHPQCPARLVYEYEALEGWQPEAIARFFSAHAVPVMKGYGAEQYPYLESGAGVHTLVALAHTAKRDLVAEIRGPNGPAQTAAPRLTAGVVRWRPDVAKIRCEWRLAVQREGTIGLARPLQEQVSYVVYNPQFDMIYSIGAVIYDVASSLVGEWVELPDPEVPAQENSSAVFDLLANFIEHGILVVEPEEVVTHT